MESASLAGPLSPPAQAELGWGTFES